MDLWGFLSTSSRVSWEYHSHGNGWHRSLPGHRLARAQKAPFSIIKLGIFSGKAIPATPESLFLVFFKCLQQIFLTWSCLFGVFFEVFHPKSSPHLPCAVCWFFFFLALPLALEFWEKSPGKVGILWQDNEVEGDPLDLGIWKKSPRKVGIFGAG